MPQSTDEQLPRGLSMRLTEVQFHLAVDRGIFGITLHYRENLLTLVMELMSKEEVASSLLTASTSPLSAVSCS